MNALIVSLVSLPAELRSAVVTNIPLPVLRSFRLVCLQNQYLYNYLYQIITDDINKKEDILNIDLNHYRNSNCLKFLQDFKFLVKSSLKISLRLPPEDALSQVDNLRRKLVEMIDVCNERIVHIDIGSNVPRNLLKVILPSLTQLKKIEIVGTQDSEIFQQLIDNNCDNLKILKLEQMTITNTHFNHLPNLNEINLVCCKGNGLNSLLLKSSNLEKLRLCKIDLVVVTEVIADYIKNLKDLELDSCRLNASLMSRATSLRKLKFEGFNLDADAANIVVHCHVAQDILEAALPRLTELKKIQIYTELHRDSEIFQQLFDNNCDSLEILEAHRITFTDTEFDEMSYLREK